MTSLIEESIYHRLAELEVSSQAVITRVDNLESLDTSDGMLHVSATLCPLYARTDMGSSYLMGGATQIEDSRVAAKWHTLTNTILNINNLAQKHQLSTELHLTFADLGVITSEQQDLPELLDLHAQIYQQNARHVFEHQNLRISWQTYSQICPQFSREISANSSSSVSREEYYQALSDRTNLFDVRVTNQETGGFNKRGRRILNSLYNEFGAQLALGFIDQYGTFDAFTNLAGGLNIYIERGDLLLNATNLFPHQHSPRMDIRV